MPFQDHHIMRPISACLAKTKEVMRQQRKTYVDWWKFAGAKHHEQFKSQVNLWTYGKHKTLSFKSFKADGLSSPLQA
jgi:hypothetical protein